MKIARIIAALAVLSSSSCTSLQDRAMTFGNTVASVQLAAAVSPNGRALAIALTPFSLAGLALYRAAGGKDYYPSGF